MANLLKSCEEAMIDEGIGIVEDLEMKTMKEEVDKLRLSI